MKIFDGELKYTVSVHDENISRICMLKLYRRESVSPADYIALVTDSDPQVTEGSVACYEGQVARAIKDYFEISDLILIRYYKPFDETVEEQPKTDMNGQTPGRRNQADRYVFDRILFNSTADYPFEEDDLFDSSPDKNKYLIPIDRTILLTEVEKLIEEKLFL